MKHYFNSIFIGVIWGNLLAQLFINKQGYKQQNNFGLYTTLTSEELVEIII